MMGKLSLFLLVVMTAAGQPNTIANLYDAFGLGKKATVLDWGYAVLIRYHGRTILFDAGGNAFFDHALASLPLTILFPVNGVRPSDSKTLRFDR